MKRFGTLMGIAVVAVAGLAASSNAQLIDDVTYQGSLRSGGAAAQGVHQVRFRIFNAPVGGAQLGEEIRTKNFLSSDNGLFTFDDLSFPANVFNGDDRWIGIAVRQGTAGAFTVLGPRQPITSAPLARYADNSGTSLNAAYQNGRVINTTPNNEVEVNGAGGMNVEGNLEVGRPDMSDGLFEFFSDEAGFPLITMFPRTGGAAMSFTDLDGSNWTRIEPDVDLDGSAFFEFSGGTGATGLQFDGVTFGGEPRFSIAGTSQSVVFDMNGTGDNTVVFPGEVIDSAEIIDEPGVASAQATGVGIPDTGALTTITSRSITVPGPGFVLALAQGDGAVNKAAADALALAWGVSDSATVLPSNQDIQFNLPAGAPAGNYDFSASAHGLFTVGSAGTFTYYFHGDTFFADAWTMFDANLTLVYIPTAYGTVVDNNALLAGTDTVPQAQQNVFSGLTPLEIQIEQDNERARVLAEIQRKEQELQDLFAEHRRMMDEAAAAQNGGQD